LRDTGGDLAVVLRAISEAKAKTDRLDARRLAELLAAGYLAEVWCPDERTRALRRFVARRAQLVRQRSRAKNEIAAALQRNLLDRPGLYDVAGTKGRQSLEGLELPDDERNTVVGCLRQIDFLDDELALVDRSPAEAGVDCAQMRRLMTVPGVNLARGGSVSRSPVTVLELSRVVAAAQLQDPDGGGVTR
jgi:transposase